MPTSQFRRWHTGVARLGPANQRGLRATGSAAEASYLDRLHDDLERAGVKHVHFESVPMDRWTTSTWGLAAAGAPMRTASYLPYSGRTPAAGTTAPLVLVEDPKAVAPGSLAGKIAVYDLVTTTLPLAGLPLIAYEDAVYDPNKELTGDYRRPYSNQGVAELEAMQAAGAVGVIVVLDFPAVIANGSYFPYDGIIRRVPGLYVDREVGATLKAQAKAGATATLKLPAKVAKVKSRNLLGVIPGRSSRCVTLHCHTDGSNAIEDNGPDAIVAIAQYLARLPRKALPHSILILLNTGHFHGGVGARSFLQRHQDDLARLTNAAVTIEHLGAREWNEISPGKVGFTGRFEPATFFTPGSKALVDAGFAALKRSRSHPSGILKPGNPTASGTADDPVWGGEGQYLYGIGHIPDANYIAGPTYLLNWGIDTTDKIDFRQMRRQAIAFTEMILKLGRTPRSALRSSTL